MSKDKSNEKNKANQPIRRPLPKTSIIGKRKETFDLNPVKNNDKS